DAEAEELAASVDLSFLRLLSGRPGPLPSPAEALAYEYTDAERAQVQSRRTHHIIGGPATVRARLTELLAQTEADELMVTSMIHDHQARLRSYTLLAEIFGLRPASSSDAARVADGQ